MIYWVDRDARVWRASTAAPRRGILDPIEIVESGTIVDGANGFMFTTEESANKFAEIYLECGKNQAEAIELHWQWIRSLI